MNWQERAEKAEAELAKLREQIKVEWLPVVGFEGLYEVSSNGDIRNVRTGNIAAKSLMGDGYVKANLWKKGKRKQTSAHRVVAEAFIGGIDGLEINHRNGVKTDNRVSNLEITTRSGNVNHSYYELGHIIKPILATSIATGDTTEYRSIEEAVRLGGFRSSSIYDCLNGKVKTHSGHSFSRPAAPVPAVADKRVDELAMLIRRLVRRLNQELPHNDIGEAAMDYLARNGISGEILRGWAEPAVPDAKTAGIIKRLRDACPAGYGCKCMVNDAASELERLSALLQSTPQAPTVPDDRVSQDESTLTMAASALVLFRAGESAEYMAKAIEALLQSAPQSDKEVRHD